MLATSSMLSMYCSAFVKSVAECCSMRRRGDFISICSELERTHMRGKQLGKESKMLVKRLSTALIVMSITEQLRKLLDKLSRLYTTNLTQKVFLMMS
jgi:hypothetical protein